MSETTTRYRKKPDEIEAVQWDGTARGATPIINWLLDNNVSGRYHDERDGDERGQPAQSAYIAIDTPVGVTRLRKGDWIIRRVDGHLTRMGPDVFAATYEPVGDGADQDRRTGDRLAAILRNG